MKKIDNQLTFEEMILGNEIYVPTYQRAYSWEIKNKTEEKMKQADMFLEDIENHIKNNGRENFYLGNFLYEQDGEKYAIIDGQQRFTTLIILLSTLENKLGSAIFKETAGFCFKDIKFSTLYYDEDDFKKYIINRDKIEINQPYNTVSAKRFVEVYQYFEKILEKKQENEIEDLISTIKKAKCSVNIIKSKQHATQIFIFENNRGKAPTNLELVKTKFMYFIYTSIEISKQEELLEKIDEYFGEIYKKIAQLENYIKEDTVLAIAVRIYKQNLKINGVLTEIDNLLKNKENENFIIIFLERLKNTFDKIYDFILTGLGKNKENKNYDDEYEYLVHSLINLDISVQIYPIIIKVLEEENIQERKNIFKALEKIILRNSFIKTRADLAQRLNGSFKNSFGNNKDKKVENINKIINLIEEMAKNKNDWWWSYWNDDVFHNSLKNGLNSLYAAKYILWKYENHLRENKEILKYTDIKNYEVEHISPKTLSEKEEERKGYLNEYDDDFLENHLHSFGNLMLLSQETNRKIQNKCLFNKLKEYESSEDKKLIQQLEVIKKAREKEFWGKKEIESRTEEITKFIKENF